MLIQLMTHMDLQVYPYPKGMLDDMSLQDIEHTVDVLMFHPILHLHGMEQLHIWTSISNIG